MTSGWDAAGRSMVTLSKKGLQRDAKPSSRAGGPTTGEGGGHSRSDDVLGGDGVDGVEPERAEDVPRAHLPAVLVLHTQNVSATAARSRTEETGVPQRDR